MDSEKVDGGVGSEVDAGSALKDSIEIESVASAADAEAAPSADSLRASEQLPQLFGEQLQAGVEALLFASGEPLPVDRIVALTGGDAAAVEAALITLGNRYAHESSGLQLVRVAGGVQIRSDVAFAPYIRALKEAKPRRLSQAALETLAIVAYRQPIVKSDIDAIRGVDVAPTLKTLLERGLVRILGHQPTVGQPALYGTTDEFLKLFGIESLAQLPTLRDVQELEREPGEARADSEGFESGSAEA
jgi:segregation and condensation protein B